MPEKQLLDLLERAFEAGCFNEVLRMIRAKSSVTLIEKVIEKSAAKMSQFDIDWDIFGAD